MMFLEVQIKILRQCNKIGVILILGVVDNQFVMSQCLRLCSKGQQHTLWHFTLLSNDITTRNTIKCGAF